MQKINSENVIYNIDSKYENDFSNHEIEKDDWIAFVFKKDI